MHTRRTFLKAARYFETPLQVIEIPFEGKKIVAYLQVPSGVSAPAGRHVLGRRGRLEGRPPAQLGDHAQQGAGDVLIDQPGTGESPVRFASRTPSASSPRPWTTLRRAQDVDGTRVGVWGRSFGAYWAAKLAYAEPTRLKGAVFHGGNAHFGFQEEWLRPALTKTASNYLLGPSSLFDSRSFVLGVKIARRRLPRRAVAVAEGQRAARQALGANADRQRQA